MSKTSPLYAALACAAALAGLSGTSSAAITVYTDATLYATATGGSGYTENFSTTSEQDHNSPLTYSGGTPTVSYSVATSDGSALWRNAFNFDYGTWPQLEAAKRLGISLNRLNEIVLRKRGITADTALRLARLLKTSPQLWMRLQADWDLHQALRREARKAS